ncbi:hypothetical protein [Paraburkholderia sartisoli]|uniref:Uncharacterized protein n=1 Tax=Paraburkholderia sartisoli TaxID=83784 RepID=A0A1H4HSJ7_9BURK|nr:hypothetical protein [Paraburkholderia sartisoli]SEB24794.1 hypothetical protein SAMN05192564_11540 [Paraburkholderia sartisoli]
MASEVDICNLALAHLGDRATVSSISPPEGSAQAEHCARFYPIARDMVLEAHEWGFATKRANLALLTDTPPPGFQFVYQMPVDCRNIIDLIDPNAPTFFPIDERCGHWQDDAFTMPAVPYELEARGDGTAVFYTNLENAIIRYVASVTDTTKFSAQVVDTIAWLLAAYLAGPVIKGDAGATMAGACMKAYQISLAQARTNDANNRRRSISQSQRPAPWLQNR